MVDIYRAAKRRGEHSTTLDGTVVNNCFVETVPHKYEKTSYFLQYTKNWSDIKLLTCDFFSPASK